MSVQQHYCITLRLQPAPCDVCLRLVYAGISIYTPWCCSYTSPSSSTVLFCMHSTGTAVVVLSSIVNTTTDSRSLLHERLCLSSTSVPILQMKHHHVDVDRL